MFFGLTDKLKINIKNQIKNISEGTFNDHVLGVGD